MVRMEAAPYSAASSSWRVVGVTCPELVVRGVAPSQR